jgi:hypothetical protein
MSYIQIPPEKKKIKRFGRRKSGNKRIIPIKNGGRPKNISDNRRVRFLFLK